MKLSYKIDKNATYLLACSFGPDSMALFDILYKAGCHFVVCYVNYHKRDIANEEQANLTKYCNEKGVTIEILDTAGMKEEDNFQEWAREVRYNFFEENYEKHNAVAVFVAHQQDDLIETYLMQKQRKGYVKEYGLTETSMIRDMVVVRPLLIYTKEDLLNYCNQNQVPYSIDMSNFETKYLRNKIRKEIINHLSEIDRENILREIAEVNNEHHQFNAELEEKIHIGPELDIRELIALEQDEFSRVLYRFIENSPKHIDLSNGRIKEIRKLCLSPTPNIQMKLTDGVYLVKEYDIITLGLDAEDGYKEYSYVLEKPGKLDTPEFYVDFTDGADERKIYEKDYPITIRSPKPNDEVEVGHHLCELRRLFIDWKVPSKYRKVWPVFTDKNGKVIYVPRYRKTFVDNHKSKFQIKFTKTKEIKNG